MDRREDCDAGCAAIFPATSERWKDEVSALVSSHSVVSEVLIMPNSAGSCEQRVDEFLGIKGQQVACFLTHANVADWQTELAGNCHHHATLGRAI